MEEKHVVCLTHALPGHVIPMYGLAKKLSLHHKVTLIGYARALDQLQIVSSPGLTVHGLPVDPDGPPDMADIAAVRQAMERMLGHMDAVIQQLALRNEPSLHQASDLKLAPCDAVILDNLCGKAFDTCVQRNLPFYSLNTGATYNLTLFVHLLDDDTPIIPFRQEFIMSFMPVPGADGKIREPIADIALRNIYLPLKRTMPYSKGVIINSLREIDEDTLKQVQQQPGMENVPLFCIGKPYSEEEKTERTIEPEDEHLLRWLNDKKASSVVYIAFGSTITPRVEQLKEIAKAVVETDRPVIWALKKELHSILPSELTCLKFAGSEGQKLVVSWAPQKLILEHESTGVFVSHCGWNSVLEGLLAGKPFVAWPQWADCLFNAELLVRGQVASLIKDAGLHSGRLVSAREIISKIGEADMCLARAKEMGSVTRRALEANGSAEQDFQQMLASM